MRTQVHTMRVVRWQNIALHVLGLCLLAISTRDASAATDGSGPLDQLTTARDVAVTTSTPTPLSIRWELDPASKQGLWLIRPYEPVFIMPMVYSDNRNLTPYSPTHPVAPTEPLKSTETEFQISLKAKAAENLFGIGADLWFAYTQQSQWQVYNAAHSSPFRETNYMPEMFMVFPTRYHLLGLTGRFIRVGVIHQSNGRDDPLSRSWNRVYAQFGFERGNFSLLIRPWARLQENISGDDNPDITHFMGYGDVLAIYQMQNSEVSLLGRFNAGNLSGTATWNFPIHGRLKAYIKATTGYGETLIDYNWRQNTIGAGILLVDWQ
ncbi:MAG: phospholipase [Gammaproteobacteria bacterium]|nr:phospholipase [Gammaproteobacteria bacterium]